VTPLTHHEILTLVGPFARDEWRVDLAATDRQNRCVVFEPRTHDHPEDPSSLSLTEHLQLENPARGRFCLRRTLTDASGLSATLEVIGEDAASVYAQCARVPLDDHFRHQAGTLAALSYALEYRRPAPNAEPGWRRRFTLGEAYVRGRRLQFDARTVPGLPAKLTLDWHPQGDIHLPGDLLAVQGWAWRPLQLMPGGWKATVKLSRREPERSREAEERFLATVAHLEQTLSQSPAHFHERFKWQRWRVVFQRSLAIQGMLAILSAIPILYWGDFGQDGQVPLWTTGVPPVMLLAIFLSWSREVPVMEIPPLPKPLVATAWEQGPSTEGVPD
jgi:hypothetical protein